MWGDTDYIALFNISRFREVHLYVNTEDKESGTRILYLDIDPAKTNGKYAEFQTALESDETFPVHKGDVFFAILGEAHPANVDEASVKLDNLISYVAIYNDLRAGQTLKADPYNDSSALNNLRELIRVYDIVTVEEEGVIPELHFKHLSAIMRVTLRNETGEPLIKNTSELVFSYPTGDDCAFIFGFSYISVDKNENGEYYLLENFKAPEKRHPLNPTPPAETTTHTYEASLKINASEVLLEQGETYDFYVVAAPRIGELPIGNELTIDLYNNVIKSGYENSISEDGEKYSITIDNFNRAIEPGKRYWFNLTAVKEEVDGKVETKLMFTNEWKALHPDTSENQGETTPQTN